MIEKDNCGTIETATAVEINNDDIAIAERVEKAEKVRFHEPAIEWIKLNWKVILVCVTYIIVMVITDVYYVIGMVHMDEYTHLNTGVKKVFTYFGWFYLGSHSHV